MTVINDLNLDPHRRENGALEAGLGRVRAALDDEIARSGASARVTAAVLADAGIGQPHRMRWLAFAATLVIAAGLGGLVETTRMQATTTTDVVVLDPLTFGAVGVDE